VLKKYRGIGGNFTLVGVQQSGTTLPHGFFIIINGRRKRRANSASSFAVARTTGKHLIPRCFDQEVPHNSVKPFATQHKHTGFFGKDLTGELFDPRYLNSEDGVRPAAKGEPNGLESTENRRSAGGHGNQHVYVRRPQVSGSAISLHTQVDRRADTFPIGKTCRRVGVRLVLFVLRA
jgi:hypothetical protein